MNKGTPKTSATRIAPEARRVRDIEDTIKRYKSHRDASHNRYGASFWDGAAKALELHLDQNGSFVK